MGQVFNPTTFATTRVGDSLPTENTGDGRPWVDENGFIRIGTLTDLMIIAFGESNSGGQVANANAAAWELAARPELPFWNVTNEVFEPLDVGTNNNLDHFNLTPGVQHSWELGLANLVRNNYFDGATIRYVQTGQGGSKVSEWEEADTFWLKFLSRTSAAKATQPSRYVIWWTLGINDTVSSVPAATWKAAAQELIGRIKVQLPNVKIYMTELMTNSALKIEYNSALAEMAAEDDDVYLVSQTGLTTQDTHHWDYESQKLWSRRFARSMRSVFGDYGAIDFSAYQDSSGRISMTSNNQHAYSSESFALTDTFAVYTQSVLGNGVVVAISDNITPINWSTAVDDPYYLGWYRVNSDLYVTTARGVTGTLVADVGDDMVRVVKSTDNLILSTSSDGGATWTTRYTRSGILFGISSVRIKMLSALVATSNTDIWVTR